MNEFKLLPGARRVLRRKALMGTLVYAALSLLIIVFVHRLFSGQYQFPWTNGSGLFGCSVIVIISHFISQKKAKDYASSYKLTFFEDSVELRMDWQPLKVIRYSEIEEITQFADGSYAIRSKYAALVIVIPALIERADALRTLLVGIKPLSNKAKKPLWHVLFFPVSTA